MKSLLVIGAGGHGRVVADTAQAAGLWERVAFLDDKISGLVLNWPVIGKSAEAPAFLHEYKDLVVAIGNNSLRVKLLRRFAGMGFHLPAIVHPTAYISPTATVEEGCVIFAQCAINAGVKIGRGAIINTGSTVDHDCILEEGVHLSPGVNLAGEVKIGRYSWLGIGSSIIQQISIGENAIIGAGSVIIKPVGSNVTVVGVPGRIIKQ